MNRRIPAQFQLTKTLWQVMHLLGDFCLSWFKRSPWKTVLKLVVMQLMLSSKGQAAHTQKSLISIRLISQPFSSFYFIFVRVGFLARFLATVIVAACSLSPKSIYLVQGFIVLMLVWLVMLITRRWHRYIFIFISKMLNKIISIVCFHIPIFLV